MRLKQDERAPAPTDTIDAPVDQLDLAIGGHLAMPPLPHHRAYGSVPRRFGGLSADERLHEEQPETTETGVGKGAVQRVREAQPPGSLRAEDGRIGRAFGDPEPTQLAVAPAARLPLDPGDATQAPPEPSHPAMATRTTG